VIKEDEEKEKALEPEPKDQNERNNSRVQGREEGGTSEMEDAERAGQLEAEGPSKKPAEEIQNKEVDLLGGVRRCPLPTVVKFLG
jgi:hypothetical protein